MFYEYHMKDFNLPKAISGPIVLVSFFLSKNSKLILLWEKWALRSTSETLRNETEHRKRNVRAFLQESAMLLTLKHPHVMFHYVSLFQRKLKLEQRFFKSGN